LKSLTPTISVIVPVYDVEKYINFCVDSILTQTFEDFECILVDDGSPDNCGAICDAYAKNDSRITVIHRQNGGLSAARNSGIEIARGEFIAFIDSDDVVEPDYLKVLYELCQKNDAKLSACVFYEFEDNLVITREMLSTQYKNLEKDNCFSKDEFLIKMFEWEVPICAHCKLYHKSLFDSIRFPENKVYEDLATTYLLVNETSRCAFANFELYGYRCRPNSIMTSMKAEQAICGIEIAKKLIKDHEGAAPAVYASAVKRGVRALLMVFVRLNPSEHLCEMKEIWRYVVRYRKSILRNKRTEKKVMAMLLLSFTGMRLSNFVAKRINYAKV
jgi:glycosyltransferase involved in cell wall biosynthesis